MIKSILIVLFLSYYMIMIAVNYDRIEECCSILKLFHLSKIEKLNKNTYIGTYPSAEELRKLKEKEHIVRIISLLNPKIPIQRELTRAEKRTCQSLGVEFVNLPGFSISNTYQVAMLMDLLHEKKKTYIHAYFYDKILKIIYQFLHNREE